MHVHSVRCIPLRPPISLNQILPRIAVAGPQSFRAVSLSPTPTVSRTDSPAALTIAPHLAPPLPGPSNAPLHLAPRRRAGRLKTRANALQTLNPDLPRPQSFKSRWPRCPLRDLHLKPQPNPCALRPRSAHRRPRLGFKARCCQFRATPLVQLTPRQRIRPGAKLARTRRKREPNPRPPAPRPTLSQALIPLSPLPLRPSAQTQPVRATRARSRLARRRS
ncbi:hypothetical protein B0H16DRAFT_1619127 [Mycena metata]|uniref:Uncharacterized protein n=1 Tax=Mycena metata TaxID=1033252 RepID=A0AAD7MF18_9AGAR|nr:hypothetical protein B0H16DRAFT_1619127 [Mycena metata]